MHDKKIFSFDKNVSKCLLIKLDKIIEYSNKTYQTKNTLKIWIFDLYPFLIYMMM